jgi:ketosteroid isomerase-like protein
MDNSSLPSKAPPGARGLHLDRDGAWIVFLCGALLALALPARGQPAVTENPAHQELRALRTNVIEAITHGDFDRTLGFVHTNVVVTWQNDEVCRGHAGLRTFFERMGKNAFKGYQVPPMPDELTLLYNSGNMGVSFGRTVARYTLFGHDYDFTNRWTATLVKDNGRWLLAAYHVSNNVLDNPLINAAKGSLYWVGAIALGLGVVIGILLGRRRAPTK